MRIILTLSVPAAFINDTNYYCQPLRIENYHGQCYYHLGEYVNRKLSRTFEYGYVTELEDTLSNFQKNVSKNQREVFIFICHVECQMAAELKDMLVKLQESMSENYWEVFYPYIVTSQ